MRDIIHRSVKGFVLGGRPACDRGALITSQINFLSPSMLMLPASPGLGVLNECAQGWLSVYPWRKRTQVMQWNEILLYFFGWETMLNNNPPGCIRQQWKLIRGELNFPILSSKSALSHSEGHVLFMQATFCPSRASRGRILWTRTLRFNPSDPQSMRSSRSFEYRDFVYTIQQLMKAAPINCCGMSVDSCVGPQMQRLNYLRRAHFFYTWPDSD